jgi:hypothetical protein
VAGSDRVCATERDSGHFQCGAGWSGGGIAAAIPRNATATIVKVLAGVIAPVHITLSLPCGEQKSTIRRVNYWNIIADTLDSLNKARLWN